MPWLLAAMLAGCKGGQEDFDVEAYCEGYVECFNDWAEDEFADDTGGYGASFEPWTVDRCVDDWEAQRELADCDAELDEVEGCFANEELTCIYGSYGSSACLSEVQAYSDCVLAGFDTGLGRTYR